MKRFNTPGYRAGDWLVISGQTGRIAETLVSDNFADQFTQCMKNLDAILVANGYPRHSVAKVNIYLRKMADREEMNGLYTDFFGEHLPARTTVGVSELSRGALVEVEAWAHQV
ncbi:MAG: reactive intermediate/imine deaminase [Variovorax paradoxus]|nr:MAG: reactive intermediate/imine deaminase [Variovorax paradoxus]PZQ11006.1 MAG: reactive intermediate/imine deaminase [Variovorax paradoxus]